MQFTLESFAAVATIVGFVVSLLVLINSRAWLILTSLLFVGIAIAVGLYARRGRQALNAASVVIEGQNIDSLNIANLRRRVNKTFVIQEAHHIARITGEDLEITWKYLGFCKAKHETAMEFSIDSQAGTSFEKLNCIAYDLGRDPHMAHAIRPVLVGPDGLSKKISVPFLEPLKANQRFGLLLKCTLPGCLKSGLNYYTSTLSFAQDRVSRCTVHLIFLGAAPSWVRVYETSPAKQAELIKNLAPSHQTVGLSEYIDVSEDRNGRSARVYMFLRDSL